MSDSSEKSMLVAKVIEALYGNMLSSPMKVRDDWPERVKEKMLNTHNTFREHHRKFALELYEKHMTVEQLQELLNFHTSDIGKSIKEAQTKIDKELRRKYNELEAQKEKPEPTAGSAVVRTRTFGLEDDEDS
jgi:hypothetical protein